MPEKNDKIIWKRLDLMHQKIISEINLIMMRLDGLAAEEQKKYITDPALVIKATEASLLLMEKTNQLFEIRCLWEKMRSSMLAEYFTDMRHDLRNPVGAIQGYTEMILEEVDVEAPGRVSSEIMEIIDASKRILNIVNKIEIKYLHSDKFLEKSKNFDEFKLVHANIAGTIPITEEKIHTSEYVLFMNAIKILIVDDARENREILTHYLKRIGYTHIRMARNGLEALEKLKKFQCDILLLDIEMPKMSGIELLVQLQEDLARRNIRVLVISASDSMENALACIKLGAEDFLPKPFNADLLAVRIRACVEKKWFQSKEALYAKEIELEKNRYEQLLNAIFPISIVHELTSTSRIKARDYHRVAVLFIDVVGFTDYCDTHKLPDVIHNIQAFSEICETVAINYNIQKIKTIGDGFLAVAGMLTVNENPVLDCINCARELIKQSDTLDAKWHLRAGVSFGTVIGGIVGHRQYLFDIWGDTVNTASRLLTVIEPDKIALTQAAWENVAENCSAHSIGLTPLKGKTPIEIFVLD